MRPYDSAMAEALTAASDWPRLWLYLAAHGRLEQRPGFWRGMTPNQFIQCWAGEYVRSRAEDARTWLLREFREQRTAGMFRGEQLSSVYTTYYLASAVEVRKAAITRGDAEMVAEVDRYLAAWLALVELVACPADAHASVAQRIASPGCRSGDEYGMDPRTDACRLSLLGEAIPARWMPPGHAQPGHPHNRHTWMETELVLDARRDALIPRYETAAGVPPVWSTMVVERRQHGHRAWVQDLMRCAGFPVWSVAVRYGDGTRASVSHRDTGRKGKSAALMGGGPAVAPPANLDGLGEIVARYVAGPAGQEDRPEPSQPKPPEPPQPPPPRPSEPPEPKEPPTTFDEKEWRHVGLTEKGGARRSVVLRISPPDAQVELELLRIVDRKVTP